MTRSLAAPYLRYTRRVPGFFSSMRRKFLMNPSLFKISVMRTLSLDAGMSTFSCSARLALRMRVRRSAMGSVIMPRVPLPARLDHARHFALEGQLPEAQPAGLELPQIAAWAAADLAAVVAPRLELRGPLRLHDERDLRHALGLPEGQAELGQQRLRLFVGAGGGHHDDVHAAHLVDLVVHDLRKDDLLLEPEGVVPAAVERLGRHALEIADAGQRHVDQPVDELVHPCAPERHLAADRRVLAELEVGDRLL